jgi:hypothetical protein
VRHPLAASRINRRVQLTKPAAFSCTSPRFTVATDTRARSAIVANDGSSLPSPPSMSTSTRPMTAVAIVNRPGRRCSNSLALNCARRSRSSGTRGPGPNMDSDLQRLGMVLRSPVDAEARQDRRRTQFPIARRACFFGRSAGRSDCHICLPRLCRAFQARPYRRAFGVLVLYPATPIARIDDQACINVRNP